MKTPEETKKGLECCAIVKTCYECPYGPIANAECMDNVDSDALAYIHQLEADNRKKDDQIWELINSSDEDREAIRQLARKLDAVMRDLGSIQGWQLCARCKNHIDSEYINIVCMECINGSNWEWRGMEEESE